MAKAVAKAAFRLYKKGNDSLQNPEGTGVAEVILFALKGRYSRRHIAYKKIWVYTSPNRSGWLTAQA